MKWCHLLFDSSTNKFYCEDENSLPCCLWYSCKTFAWILCHWRPPQPHFDIPNSVVKNLDMSPDARLSLWWLPEEGCTWTSCPFLPLFLFNAGPFFPQPFLFNSLPDLSSVLAVFQCLTELYFGFYFLTPWLRGPLRIWLPLQQMQILILWLFSTSLHFQLS